MIFQALRMRFSGGLVQRVNQFTAKYLILTCMTLSNLSTAIALSPSFRTHTFYTSLGNPSHRFAFLIHFSSFQPSNAFVLIALSLARGYSIAVDLNPSFKWPFSTCTVLHLYKSTTNWPWPLKFSPEKVVFWSFWKVLASCYIIVITVTKTY